MDPFTAHDLNRIFRCDLLGILLLWTAAASFLICVFTRIRKEIKRKIKIVGIVSIIIYVILCSCCMYIYVIMSNCHVEFEIPSHYEVSVSVCGPETLRITNNGSEDIVIPSEYKIEAYIVSTWFDMKSSEYSSMDRDRWFSDGLMYGLLSPGESMEISYDLSPYGELRPGHYRFALRDVDLNCIYAEFDITDTGEFVWPE